MTDIVERLQKAGEWEPVGDGTKYWEPHALCQEAAGLIEHLRWKVNRLMEEINK